MSEILKINNLWGGYKEGIDILRGISMEVQQGEAVGIIGLNGSGKSTFGKAIMNMIPFRKGEIFFEGEDITSLTTSQLSHRGIAIMQQGGKVFPNLSVWDNLQMAVQSCDGQWSICGINSAASASQEGTSAFDGRQTQWWSKASTLTCHDSRHKSPPRHP